MLKVNVKVMHTSTRIIAQSVTDWADITIVVEYEIVYALSIGIFTQILTLSHSKSHREGQKHFSCEYLPQ